MLEGESSEQLCLGSVNTPCDNLSQTLQHSHDRVSFVDYLGVGDPGQ